MGHVYPSKNVKIRKPRQCWGCTEKQEIGTDMRVTASVEDGRFLKSYMCGTCQDFMNSNLFSWDWFDDGVEFGGIRECDGYKEFKFGGSNAKP